MREIEVAVSILSALGVNGILLFFIKRYFDRKDAREKQTHERREAMLDRLDISMDTLLLLSYARMSEEIERLLDQGYATPTERRFLGEMFRNYKAHGWNGDMDARLEKVYHLRTDRSEA